MIYGKDLLHPQCTNFLPKSISNIVSQYEEEHCIFVPAKEVFDELWSFRSSSKAHPCTNKMWKLKYHLPNKTFITNIKTFNRKIININENITSMHR